jgi:hypothetical protein
VKRAALGAFTALLALSLSAFPDMASVVSAQRGEPARLVVRDFEGPRASRVRSQAVRALSRRRAQVRLVRSRELSRAERSLGLDLERDADLLEAARTLELAGFVEGRVSREGRSWRAHIQLRSGSHAAVVAETTVTARSPRQLDARVRTRLWRALDDAVEALESPSGEEPAESFGPAGAEHEHGDAGRQPLEGAQADVHSDAAVELAESPGGTASPHALAVRIGAQALGRRYTYNDDLFLALNTYALPMGPAIAAELEWFPGAHVSSGVASAFGVSARYERVIGVTSSASRSQNISYSTDSQLVEAGGLARHRVGSVDLRGELAFGAHRYGLAASDGSDPNLPVADYRYLRLGAGVALRVGRVVELSLDGAYLHLLSIGELDDEAWFPRASGAGLELRAGVRVDLGSGFSVGYTLGLRRYWFALDPEVGDARVAGGALDRYVQNSLWLGYRL